MWEAGDIGIGIIVAVVIVFFIGAITYSIKLDNKATMHCVENTGQVLECKHLYK